MTERLTGGLAPRQFRFSLTALFICIFGISVGLAEARHARTSWFHGLLAAVAAWGALGLSQQTRDIWCHFQGDESLTKDQRSGVRFAAFWRMAVVGLTIAGFIVSQMESLDYGTLPERPNDFNNTGQLLRSAVLSHWSPGNQFHRRDNAPRAVKRPRLLQASRWMVFRAESTRKK